jgi:ABC-type multidrug transport system fused ATPase/permease subunit
VSERGLNFNDLAAQPISTKATAADALHFAQCFWTVIGSLVVVGMSAPFVLLVLVPILPLFAWVRQRFLRTSRELKRLDAVTRSPVYALFSSTLSGLMIIRSFKRSILVRRAGP